MPRSYLGIDQSYSGCAIVTYTPATGHTGVERFDFSPKLLAPARGAWRTSTGLCASFFRLNT